MTQAAAEQPGDLVARVDLQYRWRTWALFLLLFVVGLFSIKDGFFTYPRENAAWAQLPKADRPPQPPHDPGSILFNEVIGILLPPAAVLIGAWRGYRSRGEYRLSGNTLIVPRHAPIPLDQIRSLDLVQWDRKGVATIEFGPPDAKPSSVLLNDMIYDRKATDQIVDRIEKHVEAQDAATAAAAPSPEA